MFQSTPKHSLSEIWKRLPLSQMNSTPPKGEVSNRSLFLMNHNHTFRRAAVAAVLGAALSAAAGAAHAQTPTEKEKQAPVETQTLPAVQKSGAVEYLSGGIGKDESTAFEAESRAWPLALQFAVTGGQRAQFASDVQVTVRDAAGRTVLQTASNGPFLLLRVAPGRYDVEASLQGVVKHRKVSVKKGASTKVMLAWPAAAGDAKS